GGRRGAGDCGAEAGGVVGHRLLGLLDEVRPLALGRQLGGAGVGRLFLGVLEGRHRLGRIVDPPPREPPPPPPPGGPWRPSAWPGPLASSSASAQPLRNRRRLRGCRRTHLPSGRAARQPRTAGAVRAGSAVSQPWNRPSREREPSPAARAGPLKLRITVGL